MTKFCTLLSGVLLFFSLISHAQWNTIYQGNDTSNKVRAISFYTPVEGYVAGSSYIGFTQNGGQSFVKRFITQTNVDFGLYSVNLLFGFNLSDIKALNRNEIIASGDYGLEPSILYSSNGGVSWKLVYHKNLPATGNILRNSMYKMQFPDNITGFTFHNDGFLKTTDGGKTWTVSPYLTNANLEDISFATPQIGYAISKNRLYVTTNGGAIWSERQAVSSSQYKISAAGTVAAYMYAASGTGDGAIYKTGNRGLNWSQTTSSEVFQIITENIVFVNDSTGYFAAADYIIYKTTNSGNNWEACSGLGYSKLYFFNDQIGYAGGSFDNIAKTTNGGEPRKPKAFFKITKANFCGSNSVDLENFSRLGYSYRWYLNGQLISTSYNSQYTADSIKSDTIKLIVSNGSLADSTIQYVEAQVIGTFRFVSKPQQDTVCFQKDFVFDIPNSDPQTYYKASLNGKVFAGAQGNGGILQLRNFLYDNSNINIAARFAVIGTRTTECGTESWTNYHDIFFLTANIPVTPVTDTVCSSNHLQFITILNSLENYEYWANNNVHVMGNGGVLKIPLRINIKNFAHYPEFDGGYGVYGVSIFARHKTYGCESLSNQPVATVRMIVRDPLAKFRVQEYESKTGSALAVDNNSTDAIYYSWRLNGNSIVNNNSSLLVPSNMYSTKAGAFQLRLIATSKEGCSDTTTNFVEIYDSTKFSNSVIGVLKADSIVSQNYYRVCDSYKDRRGNLYVAGAKMKMRNNFVDKGNEIWFLTKKDKNGNTLWEKENLVSFEGVGHFIIEDVIADDYENIYLYGHCQRLTNTPFMLDAISFNGYQMFVMKLNKNGNVIWSKSARVYNGIPDPNIKAGSLLLGKDNDVYLKLSASPMDFYQWAEQPISFNTKEGVLFHFDQEGLLKDYIQYPDNSASRGYYVSDNFHHNPRMQFNVAGQIVFTVLLDSTTTLSSYKGIPVTFNSKSIYSALAVYDTLQKIFVNLLPIFKTEGTLKKAILPVSFAMDPDGSYYVASFSRKPDILNFLPYALWSKDVLKKSVNPSFKLKTYISKFFPDGTIAWQKLVDGLKPVDLLLMNNQVVVGGENFQGDYNQALYEDGNEPYVVLSDTLYVGFPLASRKKISCVTDTQTGEQNCITANGGIDILMMTLDTDGKNVSLKTLGGDLDDHLYRLEKDSCNNLYAFGAKDLKPTFFTASEITRYQYNQLQATIMQWNFAGPVNSTVINCSTELPALRFEKTSYRNQCVDSTASLYWSAGGIKQVDISYRSDGQDFKPLISNYPADSLKLIYNLKQFGINGKTLFRISATELPSIFDTINLVLGKNPTKRYFGRDTLMCYWDTTTIKYIPDGPYSHWWTARGNGGAYISPGQAGGVGITILDTTNGCSVYDIIVIRRKPYFDKPEIDQALTSNKQIVSNHCELRHEWRLNGVLLPDTGCILIPKAIGTYSVATVKDGCVSNILGGAGGYYTVTSLPKFITWEKFAPNSIQCVDSTIKLAWSSDQIGNVRISVRKANETNFKLVASSIPAATKMYEYNLKATGVEGPLLFKIEDELNTTISDTINIKTGLKPSLDLGPDKIVCAGLPVNLEASAGNLYLWSTGAATQQITVTPLINTSIWVSITSNAGCKAVDTVSIKTIENPAIDLGTDKTICRDTEVKLQGPDGYTYQWSTGETSREIVVIATETKKIALKIVSASGCEASDSILLTVKELPVVNLGADKTICAGSELTLSGPDNYSYFWSTGAQSREIVVRAVSDTLVWLTIRSSDGCQSADTIRLTAESLPIVQLGSDITSCAGEAIVLEGPSGPGYRFLWSTGDITATASIITNSNKKVWLEVTSSSGCKNADTLNILSINVAPPVITRDSANRFLKTDACGKVHKWFIDGTEIIGESGCQLLLKKSGTYQASITDASCESALSDTVVVNLLSTEAVIVSPNPATNKITIAANIPADNTTVSIEIIGLNGHRYLLNNYGMQSQGLFIREIFLAGIINQSGMYIVRTTIGNSQYSTMLMVTR